MENSRLDPKSLEGLYLYVKVFTKRPSSSSSFSSGMSPYSSTEAMRTSENCLRSSAMLCGSTLMVFLIDLERSNHLS